MAGTAKTPVAAFLILEGRDAGRVVPIDNFPFFIGRSLENHMVLGDEQASRKHARIDSIDGDLTLLDQQSRNGLFVNDRRITQHQLKAGDRVRIGVTVLVFQGEGKGVMPSLHDEPTAIRSIASLEEPKGRGPMSVLPQAAKLFRTTLPPKELAAQLLELVFQTFGAERCQIFWNDEREIRVARSRKEGWKCPTFELPPPLTAGLGKPARGTAKSAWISGPPGGKSYELGVALCADEIVLGWLYLEKPSSSGPFRSADVEQIETLSYLAGGILERSSALSRARQLQNQVALMEKHLSPEVARMLSSKGINIEESALSVEEREVTVLFSDIQGFTPLSERLKPQELATLLNEYFQRMVDIIILHHGMPNKFIGDAIMALFGAPEVHGNDPVNAVASALDMIGALRRFWEEIDDRKRFNIRIGINTGRVVAGNIGSEKKMEYTVLGDAVNVASRLEGISPPNTITIGARTAELVKSQFQLEEVPLVRVKGKSEEMQVYRVIAKLT